MVIRAETIIPCRLYSDSAANRVGIFTPHFLRHAGISVSRPRTILKCWRFLAHTLERLFQLSDGTATRDRHVLVTRFDGKYFQAFDDPPWLFGAYGGRQNLEGIGGFGFPLRPLVCPELSLVCALSATRR